MGPFNAYTDTGRHFGPALTIYDPPPMSPGVWIPKAVGEAIYWSGTSSANLDAQYEMRWGALIAVGTGSNVGGPYVGYLVDNLTVIPEPGTLVLAGAGLLLLAAGTRQRPVHERVGHTG